MCTANQTKELTAARCWKLTDERGRYSDKSCRQKRNVGCKAGGYNQCKSVEALRAEDTQRTTSIKGKHPVETVISTLLQRGGTGRDKRTETESEREHRKKITRSTKHLRDARPLICSCKTANNTHARQHTRCNTHRLCNIFSAQWDVTVAKGRSFKAIIVTASSLRTDTRQCEYITKSLNILPGIWPAYLAADTALL